MGQQWLHRRRQGHLRLQRQVYNHHVQEGHLLRLHQGRQLQQEEWNRQGYQRQVCHGHLRQGIHGRRQASLLQDQVVVGHRRRVQEGCSQEVPRRRRRQQGGQHRRFAYSAGQVRQEVLRLTTPNHTTCTQW